MKDFILHVAEFQKKGIDEKYFDKIEGDLHLGGKCDIVWEGRDYNDEGYVFALPNQDMELLDVCIHVPCPDNSDGIGDAPEEHVHLYFLLSNKKVKKVIFHPLTESK